MSIVVCKQILGGIILGTLFGGGFLLVAHKHGIAATILVFCAAVVISALIATAIRWVNKA